MRRMLGTAVACMMLLSLLAAPVMGAATRTLVNCGAGADLQAAIDAANPGETLVISGTCVGNFSALKALTFQGRGHRPTVAGAPAATAPVLSLSEGTVVGLTVTGGAGDGISDYAGGPLTLIRSQVTNNEGNGVLFNGPLTVDRATVRGNTLTGITSGPHAGGVPADIRRSVISNNGYGGIYTLAVMTLTDTTVRDNTRPNEGGGILNSSSLSGRGVLTLVRSRVRGNSTSGDGGGISNHHLLTIRDSKVVGNSAAGRGGGIYNGTWPCGGELCIPGVLAISDSKVVRNTAGADGGGIYSIGTATLDSVTFKHNKPNNCVGVVGC